MALYSCWIVVVDSLFVVISLYGIERLRIDQQQSLRPFFIPLVGIQLQPRLLIYLFVWLHSRKPSPTLNAAKQHTLTAPNYHVVRLHLVVVDVPL